MTAKRVLGFWACTSLIMGNMVGAGIFLLPAALAKYGSISLLGWLVSAVGALLLALIFARLSLQFPLAGGPYAYIRQAFGNFVGFQMAFSYWLAVIIANAAMMVAMVGYLHVFFPVLDSNHFLAFSIATGTLWVITLINIIGIREAKWIQMLTNVLKIVPMLLIAFVGYMHFEPVNFIPFNASGQSSWQAIAGATLLTLWAFVGLESATIPAQHVKNPQRTIPLSTIFGTLLAAAFYIVTIVAIMGLLPQSQLANSSAPFADAAQIFLGSGAVYMISAIAVLACFSCTVGWVLLQGQVPLAAANDGLFPKIFAKLGKRNTPYVGLIISTLIATVIMGMNYNASLVHQFTLLITLSTLAFLIPYLYTSIASMILFLKDKTLGIGAGVKVSKSWLAYTCLSIFAFIFALLAIVGSGKEAVFYGSLLLFAAAPIYAFLTKNTSS